MTTEATTTVGFIGLGRMGVPMATNVAGAGARLVLHNRTAAIAEELAAELGCDVAETPRVVAERADLVVTMLADESALRSVLAGPDGVLSGLRPGAVVVDMGTTGPVAIGELAPVVADAGGVLVDAPVSGSTAAARAGRLTIVLGAPDDVVEAITPVLRAMGDSIHHVGDVGAGSIAKLAVNNVIFAIGNAVSESLVVAEQSGIDRSVMYDVLEDSAAAAPMVGYRREAFLEPDRTPPAFAVTLAQKDMRLVTDLAASLGVTVTQAEATLALLGRVVDDGLGDHDVADVAVHLRRHAEEGAS